MKQIIAIIFIVISSHSFSGCAGFYKTGEVIVPPVPEKFNIISPAGETLSKTWWTSFNDSTLSELMVEAFESNPSFDRALMRLGQFEALFDISKSSLFPFFRIGGSYLRSDNIGEAPQKTIRFYIDGFDVNLNTSYEIDYMGRLSANRNASKANMLAARHDLDAFILILSSQVAKAYYAIRELQLQIDLNENTIRSFEDYFNLVEGRYLRGVVSALDVHQAEFNLAGARSQASQLEASLTSAQYALSVLLGEYPQALLDGDNNVLPESVPGISAGIPSQLINRRPDIAAAFQRLNAAGSRWAEAFANRFPTFSLTASAGGTSDKLQDAVNPNSMVWNLIGNLSAPLFEGGRRKANSKLAEAVFRDAAAQYTETVLNAFREVEDALNRIEKQKTYLVQLEKQVQAARSTLEIATDRYLRGVTNYLQVVSAQTAFFNVRSSHIQAKRVLIGYHIDFVTALGGDWTDEVRNTYVNAE